MISYERSEGIEIPPDRLFDFAVDQTNLPKWSPEVIASEILTGGELRVGSKLRQTRRQGRRQVTNVVSVVAHDPPRVHAVHARVLGVDATFTFRFHPERGGTRVDFQAAVVGRGLGKLLERPLARMMERSDDQLLVRLRKAVGK